MALLLVIDLSLIHIYSLKENQIEVIGIGKIPDIFVDQGITPVSYTHLKLEIMKTFIAIEQPELLENIKFNLEKTNKMTVVGTAQNGIDCLNFFNQRTCDLLIIDLMLSEIDGIGVLKKLKEMNKQSFQKVICITQFTNQTICNMLEELGVTYCFKSVSYTHLDVYKRQV